MTANAVGWAFLGIAIFFLLDTARLDRSFAEVPCARGPSVLEISCGARGRPGEPESAECDPNQCGCSSSHPGDILPRRCNHRYARGILIVTMRECHAGSDPRQTH